MQRKQLISTYVCGCKWARQLQNKIRNSKKYIEYEGFSAIQIYSLSLSSTADPLNDQNGHVTFTKKSTNEECNADESFIKFRRKNTFNKFINGIKKRKNKLKKELLPENKSRKIDNNHEKFVLQCNSMHKCAVIAISDETQELYDAIGITSNK